jgi:hypothetical protein
MERRSISRKLITEYVELHNVTPEKETDPDFKGSVSIRTLPSGTISMSQVNTELRRPASQSINLNDAQVRSLAGKPSGAISMNDLRGKSWELYITIGSNATNYVLRNNVNPPAGAGAYGKVNVTINTGVWVYGTSTGTPAFNGHNMGGKAESVFLDCRGRIQGRGGNGGRGGNVQSNGSAGGGGGIGLQRGSSTSWSINSPYNIQGGGGGGGGGGARQYAVTKGEIKLGGGGGGGGCGNGSGGAGGTGAADGNGNGQGGGNGSLSGGGGGGNGGTYNGNLAGRGGNGGGGNGNGAAGAGSSYAGGGGGATGAHDSVISGTRSNITQDGQDGAAEVVKYNDYTIAVKSSMGHEVVYSVPPELQEYAHLIVPKELINHVSKDTLELEVWSRRINSKTTVYEVQETHNNVDNYSKIEILGDMIRVYTGETYELIHVPQSEEHRQLVMGTELLVIVNSYIIKNGL